MLVKTKLLLFSTSKTYVTEPRYLLIKELLVARKDCTSVLLKTNRSDLFLRVYVRTKNNSEI